MAADSERYERGLDAVASQFGIERKDVEPELRGHVRWAIEHGSSRQELEALVTMRGVCAGYPRASVAIEIVREELDQPENEAT